MAENLSLCGNILSTDDYTSFTFRCIKCKWGFGCWSTFVNHLQQEHRSGNSQDDNSKKKKKCLEAVCEHTTKGQHLDKNDKTLSQDCGKCESREEKIAAGETLNDPLNLQEADSEHIDQFGVLMQLCEGDTTTEPTLIQADISDEDDDVQQESQTESEMSENESIDFKSFPHQEKMDYDIVLGIKSGQRYRRIQFKKLPNKIADEFISILRQHPVLYEEPYKGYKNLLERKNIIKQWIPLFEQRHNVQFSYRDLLHNYKALRTYYRSLEGRKHLDPAANHIRESCSFLPHLELKPKYTCPHCGNYYFNETNYKHHMDSAHDDDERLRFKCPKCSKELKSAEGLEAHDKIVHNNKFDKKFPCPQCEIRCASRGILVRHMTVHTGEKKYICESCGKAFARYSTLSDHKLRVHTVESAFKCHLCPKSFKLKPRLKDHLNVHLNIRKYKCPWCDKAFCSSHSLMRHKQIHDSVKRYACKLCEARFHQRVGLNRHLKVAHEIVHTSVLVAGHAIDLK